MPIAYQVDESGDFLCTGCYADDASLGENDVTAIRWTADWSDEWSDEYQELECSSCGDTLDTYEPEPEDEDDDSCDCDACDECGSIPRAEPTNLAAYMAAFIKAATPRVAESVGA